MRAQWRLLQLADSAFPAGGFAHSGGLEAALHHGPVDVERFAEAALWQAGTFALPFLREAHRAPDTGAALDRRCEASLASHVARRASRAQGRAWLRTCAEAFAVEAALPLGHLPVAFGVTARALEVAEDDARVAYLHVTARGVLSAAVRLGCLGPHAAQRAQDRLAGVAAAVLAACAARPLERAAHAAPIQELFGTLHDTLPARLFQS
jgi:urease accessory protein